MTIMEDAQELRNVRAMGKDNLTPGMRNFDSWLRGPLPRSCSPTDIDFCLHDGLRSRFLWFEMKPDGIHLNQGQLWMLQDLAKRGDVVVVVFDPFNGVRGEEMHTASVPLDTPVRYLVVPPHSDWSPTNDIRTGTVADLNFLCHEFVDGRIPPAFR